MKQRLLQALTLGLFFMPWHLNAGSLHIEGVKTMLKDAHKTVKEIDNKTLKNMVQKEEEFFLVDLREKEQQDHGEIYHFDTLKISRGYLEFEIEEKIPDKKAKIVVYCCSGKRSLLAAKSLMQMGYTNVYSLKGGLREWVESGLPLDTVYGEMILKKD